MDIGIRHDSLFTRTAAILSMAFFAFSVLVITFSAWLVVFPVGKRSADDFAALILLAARTRVELPPEALEDFRRELRQQHGLMLSPHIQDLRDHHSLHPYLRFLRTALQQRTGKPLQISSDAEANIWLAVPVPSGKVWIGFQPERVGARPLLVLTVILLLAIVLALIVAVMLAREVVRPLASVSAAVSKVSSGKLPPPLPETGPREIVILARTINRMSLKVQALLENRTLLLSGISHDLRTPLTRLRLSLTMLADEPDPDLINRMDVDLQYMEYLISQFLELAQGLTKDPQRQQRLDLDRILRSLISEFDDNRKIHFQPGNCTAWGDPQALRRIVNNLLENALRYGNAKPIQVRTHCQEDNVNLLILDRGPGIPAKELQSVFRPFHRLNAARTSHSGGSGLGLAIAKQLATGQGWKIDLAIRDGGGIKASIRLPKYTQHNSVSMKAVARGSPHGTP